MVEPFLRVTVSPQAGVTQNSSRRTYPTQLPPNQAAQTNRGTALSALFSHQFPSSAGNRVRTAEWLSEGRAGVRGALGWMEAVSRARALGPPAGCARSSVMCVSRASV